MEENKVNNNPQTTEETPTPRDSMVWFRSFMDSVEVFNDIELKYECYVAIFKYGFDGILPTSNNPIVLSIFYNVKHSIDNSRRRYDRCVENGKKGGAPKGNQNAVKKQPRNNQETTKEQPKNNPYEYENDYVYEYENVYVYENDYVYSDALSHISKTFENKYPHKKMVITNIAEVNKINLSNIAIEQLLSKIEQSNFLLTNNNLGLEWCLLHYDRIINGDYDNYTEKQPKNEPNGKSDFTAGLKAVAKHLETLEDIQND